MSDTIDSKISDLVGSAPETLNTLGELAKAFRDNKNVVDFLNQSISKKQDNLVSGTNIKTINNESILGAGNINIEAGGITIVDSIYKLDPDAPQGSLATLATNNIKEVSLSTLYQFTEEELTGGDMETILATIANKGSNIDNLNIMPPTGPIVEENQGFKFLLVGVGDTPSVCIVEIYDGGCCFTDIISGQEETYLWEYNGGEITVYEDGIAQLKDLVASGDWKYANGVPVDYPEVFEHYYSIIDQCFSTTISSQETTLYIKDVEGWRNINEVKIVDSVDKLDKNAPQGSLASVAVNTVNEVPFSELYQPTSDEVNLGAGVVDTTNLSRVSGISVNSSYDTTAEIQNFMTYLFSKDLDMQGGVGHIVLLGLGAAATINFATQEQQELELFTPNEDGTITVNEGNLAIINNLLSSTEFVYGGIVNMDNGEPLDPSFVDVFYKSSSGEQKTELYIKDVNGWKVVSDEELKSEVNNLQAAVDILGDIVNNLEDKTNNLEDKAVLIVNSVDELPQDAPLGSLASVITKEDKKELVPVSKVFVAGGAASGLTIVIPEKVDPTDFNTTSTLGLNFSTCSYNRGSIEIGLWSGKKSICGTDGNSMPSILAEYDSDGNLQNVNQSLIDTLLSTVTTYRSISGSDILDKYLFIPNDTIVYKTEIYAKNPSGWEQYSELVDQSVTTEKVAEGAITMEKLSQEVQASLSKADSALQEHQSLEGYATKDEVATAIANAITNTLKTEV